MRVQLSEQVLDFVRRLPPEPKRRMRRALRDLAHERGGISALEAPLDDYCRLRVGAYRIVFAYAKPDLIQCIYAERRNVVYELLLDLLGID